MKKNHFLSFIFVISVILTSCASTKNISDDLGIRGQSYRNPKVVRVNAKGKTDTTIFAGEFYKFDFNDFKNVKDNHFAIIEVLNKGGNRISLYSIGYSKKFFSDTFYISPNAARVNIALSDSEYSYSQLKESFVTEESDLPLYVYSKSIIAGEMNTFDFTMFNGYYSRDFLEEKRDTYAIIECIDDTGRIISKKVFPTSTSGKSKGFLIPVKTSIARLSVSGDAESYYSPIDIVAVKHSENPITIKTFVSSSFRTLDFNIYQDIIKQDFGIIEYLDANYNVIYSDYIKNDGEGKIVGKVYVPRNAIHANIILNNIPSDFQSAIDYIDILSSANASALKTAATYFDQRDYKTETINAELERFFKYLDVRTLRTDPDTFIDFLVKRIDHIAQNDFEKIKLYHDATILLLTYQDFLEDPICSGDYRTAIRKGFGNSYAFAVVFKELCRAGNFYCINIGGNVKKVDHVARARGKPFLAESTLKNYDIINKYNADVDEYNERISVDYKRVNQYWNIVFIDGNAYLVDCSLDSKETPSSKFYSTDWLFVPPEEFIKTHRPADSEFQLLANPLTLQEYSRIEYKDFGKNIELLEKLPLELTKEELKALKKQQKSTAKLQSKLAKAQIKLQRKQKRVKEEQSKIEEDQAKLIDRQAELEQELSLIEQEQIRLKRKIDKQKEPQNK